jgi:hypothetical protein
MQLARLAALLCLLAACYDTPAPACAFSCGQEGACPDGYSCRADSWCKRDDLADEFTCPGRMSPDGSPTLADSSVADSSPDDAALPDSSPGDPPDAADFDAPPPDASSLPDAMSISGD